MNALDKHSLFGITGVLAAIKYQDLNPFIAFCAGLVSLGYMSTRWFIMLRHEARRMRREKEDESNSQ